MITRTRPNQPARGFTLTELLVVILIIGILITFILIAARDSVQTAQKKATLSLITKLETGLNERLEAILAQRGEVTPAHEDIAAMYLANGTGIKSPQRAQVIAQFDQVRAEVPDVFVINPAPLNSRYPFNFAGIPYPLAGNTYDYFVLPLGKGLTYVPGTGYIPTVPRTPGTGIFGASYTAAAGIYKNLGYLPEGYDGVDNDNDGFVDDWNEGIGADPMVSDPDNIAGPQVRLSVLINSRLRNHTHNTARAEMLYALLVEGQGPLGSVFSRDDFTDAEVQDTDHDGLPEFVDAWGQPLRFYRWPIFYSPVGNGDGTASAYIQKGPGPYSSTEVRQNDPLDPAQTLVAPSWWWAQVNTNPQTPTRFASAGFNAVGKSSASAVAFMTYFHSLLDPQPIWLSGNPLPGASWDRANFLQRRAYYSRPLIISAGPDEMLGIAELGTDYRTLVPATLDLGVSSDGSGAPLGVSALSVMQIENLASQYDPNHFLVGSPPSPRYGQINTAPFNQTDQFLSGSAGLDDISNQSLSSPGAGVR